MQNLMGDRLMNIPILEFQDIFKRSYWGYKFPNKINSPIVIVVDDFTNISTIVILYRIKVIEKPKFSCLSVSRKKEIRALTFSKTDHFSLFSSISPFSKLMLSELQPLFKEGFYIKTFSCFALYQSAKILLY
jgi:hypothetical protein